jgi:hypothetical protein
MKMSFTEAAELPLENTTVTETATDTVPEPVTTSTTTAPVEVVEDQAIVPAQSHSPTLPSTYVEDDDAAGEFGSDRYASYPSLKIVSKTSAMAEDYGIGAWIIGSKTVEPVAVGKMDVPLPIVCVKWAMAWQEQVTFGEQRIPKMFAKLEDAIADGFTAEWGSTRPRVAEVLKALLWIPQPEGVDEPHIFSYEGPEGPGALAWFFAARTTFGTCGKTLIQAKRTFLSADKGGMASGLWHLTAQKASRNGNTWLLPRLAPKGKNSAALTEYLKSIA